MTRGRTREPRSPYKTARYRLRARDFVFERIKGRVFEKTTGLPAYCTATQVFNDRKPPPAPERRPRTLYLKPDGSPSDDLSARLLRRDMTNFLCVVLCRICPEPTLVSGGDNSNEDDGVPLPSCQEGWEALLEREGLGVISGGEHFAPPGESRRRSLIDISPAEWRRAVTKRLALFFERGQKDSNIVRMGNYFLQTSYWNRWRRDPELRSLIEQWFADPRLQRLVAILEGFTCQRAAVLHNHELAGRSIRLVLKNPRGRFVLNFPPHESRTGMQAQEQRRIQKLLVRLSPSLITGRGFNERWLAAAVWLGRDFLEAPKRLSRLQLTQETVAECFSMTRRQLSGTLATLRRPGFAISWPPIRS